MLDNIRLSSVHPLCGRTMTIKQDRHIYCVFCCRIQLLLDAPLETYQARSHPSDNGGSFSSDFGPFSGFEN